MGKVVFKDVLNYREYVLMFEVKGKKVPVKFIVVDDGPSLLGGDTGENLVLSKE
jgi:hypothetical protein